MRIARAADHWRIVQKRRYNTWISSLNMNGLLGFDNIEFNQGIFAICGLNGAGKSTVVSSLKAALGIQLTEQDIKRLRTFRVSAKLIYENNEITCSNEDGSRAFDVGLADESAQFIDYLKSIQALKYFLSQKNIEELIEQNEEKNYTDEEKEELSYIVGKQYTEASLVEINDVVNDETPIGTIPFFKVKCDGVVYDSTTMGIGEHFIFYIHWVLNTIPNNSILIVEEPETFISIASQENLMNYIASVVAEKGISVIISTHSPFILDKVPSDNICILYRFAGLSNVKKPDKTISTFEFLGSHSRKEGVIFVEDYVSKLLLSIILENNAPDIMRAYNIQDVGGDGEISRMLSFPSLQDNAYRFIGVYDGDVEGQIKQQTNNFNWPYLFFPFSCAPEIEFKNILTDQDNIRTFCDMANISYPFFAFILSKHAGKDAHDWFNSICEETNREPKTIIRELYKIWSPSIEDDINCFIESLYEKINA